MRCSTGRLVRWNKVKGAAVAEIQDKYILIVDDDEEIRTAIEAALAEIGTVEIEMTGNGNDAVEMIQNRTPDLLVLDQMLPGRSGFLVLEKIRPLRQETGKPPVIMITANPGSRHKVYAETLGVDLYLNKPFRMTKLIDSARELLSKES